MAKITVKDTEIAVLQISNEDYINSNTNSNSIDFDGIRNQAGLNDFKSSITGS